MRVLIRELTTAAWEQLVIFQIFCGTALHAPFNENGTIPQATQFRLSSAFVVSLTFTTRYFVGPAQDRLDKSSCNSVQHCFCIAASGEVTPRVIAGLVAEFSVKEQVALFGETIIDAPCRLDRSFVGRYHLPETDIEALASQNHYNLFNSNHHITEVHPITCKTTVWIHASISTKPGPFAFVRLCLQSQPLHDLPCRSGLLLVVFPHLF